MKRFASTALKTQTTEMFSAAVREPVEITKHGKPAFVLMSEEHFRRLEALEDAVWGAKAMAVLEKGEFVGADKAQELLEKLLAEKSI